MESARMVKRIAIGLLCLSGLISIGFNIYQYKQIRNVTQGTANEISSDNEIRAITQPDKGPSTSSSANQNLVLASGENQSINREAEDLKYQIAAAKEELAMVKKEVDDDAAKEAEEEEARLEAQKRSQEVAKIYQEDPSYKKMLRNNMKISLAAQYADLFEILNLTDEKIDNFKDILVDENMARRDLYSETQEDENEPLSQEEQEELASRYGAIREEYKAKMAELLGQEGYEEYQTYQETSEERYYVGEFMGSLDSDETLTETQKKQLIEAMYKEVNNVKYEPIDSETSSSATQKEIMDWRIEYRSRRDEAYLKAGKDILSASQYEKLEAYLTKQRDNLKLLMEVSLMNSPDAEKESND